MVAFIDVSIVSYIDTFIACVISKCLLLGKTRGDGMVYSVQTIQFKVSLIVVKQYACV